MNFNPQNQNSLLGLVAALKAGLDPSVGYNIYGDIYGQQAQQIANRQDRLQGMADLLIANAQAGVSFEGAQSIADAQPGPMGPAVQSMLSSLYPTGGIDQGPDLNYLGAPMDGPIGSPAGSTYVPGQGQVMTTGQGPTATSPAMPPPPEPSLGAQVQEQQLLQQQALQPLWAEYAQNAAIYASQGKTREQFISDAMKAYPELFSADIQTAQQIALTAFATPAPGA